MPMSRERAIRALINSFGDEFVELQQLRKAAVVEDFRHADADKQRLYLSNIQPGNLRDYSEALIAQFAWMTIARLREEVSQ